MSDVRISKDIDDIRKVLGYLKQILPFTEDSSLIENIAKVQLLMKLRKRKNKMSLNTA